MNVKILYININQSFSVFEKLLPMVSTKRQNNILKLRFEKEKITSLLTELLIRHEVSRQLHIPCSEVCIGYGDYGKPFLINDSNYFFSVSHSGNCIAFISSNCPIGIDLEQIQKCNMLVAKHCFTSQEYKFVEESIDANEAFYKIWTAKEAYVKMLGVGLSKCFKSFDILDKNLNCFFSTLCLPEYVLSVCSKKKTRDNITIEEIYEDSLM